MILVELFLLRIFYHSVFLWFWCAKDEYNGLWGVVEGGTSLCLYCASLELTGL